MEEPIEQDAKFQEREYAFEVWGRWLVGAIILSALLGLFGSGLFSKSRLGLTRGELEYSRFGRQKSEMEFAFTLNSSNDPVRLKVPNSFLKEIDIIEILPNPIVEGDLEFTRFSFPNPSGKGLKIRFLYEPTSMGDMGVTLGIDGEETSLKQFIFP